MKKAFGRIKTVTAPANHLDDFFGVIIITNQ